VSQFASHKVFLGVSFILFLLAAIFSTGFHHYDEHFQLLEFANYKLGNISQHQLPWEFHQQMRPGFQVFIAYLAHQFWGLFGVNSPFFLAFFLRLLSAVLSLAVLRKCILSFGADFSAKNAQVFLLITLFLCYNFYLGVRFSSENWSGIFLLFGILSLYPFEQKQSFKNLFLAGIFFGLAFHFRYQIALAIAGLMFWWIFISRMQIKRLLYLFYGLLLALIFGVLIDFWFYGEWVLAAWKYFDVNLVGNKVADFGVDPWWYYFAKFFEKGIPPISVLIIIAIVVLTIKKPKSWLTWCILPFILVHFFLGHKELRFLFPLLFFIPLILIKSYQLLPINLKKNKYFKSFLWMTFGLNLVLIIPNTFQTADPFIAVYKSIYDHIGSNNAILYHQNNDPYHRSIPLHFYKPKQLNVVSIEDFSKIPEQQDEVRLIVMSGKGDEVNLNLPNAKVVYQSIPEWMDAFNFNDWQSRTKAWKVYELENSK